MTSTPAPLRVAIVGARRQRQGTGAFVARELLRRGCRLEALVGTRPETVAAAVEGLEARHGVRCRGYTSLAELLAREAVDVVAVCSPAETHLEHLLLAAEAGCHAFAEKPLHWSDDLLEGPPEAAGELAADLAQRFADRGRALALNTQWPFTLEAFRRLHPDAPAGAPGRLEMWLSPTTRGHTAVVDSAPHLLSLLHALGGPGRLDDVEVEASDDGEGLRLTCGYLHAAGRTAVALRLRRCLEQPRPAGYALDGRRAERRVSLPDYQITFEAEGRRVPCRDPLAASVDAFVDAALAGAPPDVAALAAGTAQLTELAQAARSGECVWPSR